MTSKTKTRPKSWIQCSGWDALEKKDTTNLTTKITLPPSAFLDLSLVGKMFKIKRQFLR